MLFKINSYLNKIIKVRKSVQFQKERSNPKTDRSTFGFEETERIERGYDTIVMMDGSCTLEIYIDPTHPARVDKPEALGLRHLAFEVKDLDGIAKEVSP